MSLGSGTRLSGARVCVQNALALTSLYYAYFDVRGIPCSVYDMVTVLPTPNEYHSFVLTKSSDGKAAIVDWSVITSSNGKLTFLPISEARATLKDKLGRLCRSGV